MRRTKWRGTILFVIILTVMGATAGLRLYGVGTETTAAGSGATVVSSPAAAAPSATPTPSATATDSATPTDTPTASPTAAAPAPAATTPKVVDGAVENTRYGPVQVEVTFTGTQITAVKTLQVPTGGRSDEINNYAAPELAQEVMSSQSANIDTVSGATYTSEAYKASVQSAIDLK